MPRGDRWSSTDRTFRARLSGVNGLAMNSNSSSLTPCRTIVVVGIAGGEQHADVGPREEQAISQLLAAHLRHHDCR
jgi:hypothetical protein